MKRIAIVCLALMLGACAHKLEPVYNVDDPMPASAQALSLDKIEVVIVEAGQTRGWKFQHVAAGHLVATQTTEKLSATVDIYFDKQSWRIAYQSSVGMKAENGTIHDHYNFWIRNLEHDISARLANAAILSK